ncbi:WhiB family transcriptional regulator [Flexivirga oryzae]|uniref:Transcriptional regulator WhiB n=1 Tax=Flexivirga oryzae TaxID=1794944 RepID=A0A839NIM4_9MICO|nr:WhiB family redox-sensing transcriptional regulator [Flexivirga oryzae]
MHEHTTTERAVHADPAQTEQEGPRTRGRHDKEVPPMMLTDLIDATGLAIEAGEQLPCHQNDPELWFAERPEDVEFAKALCTSCPLREACLAGAKERSEPWGVWGGELFAQGVVIPRKRPRGRPRKETVAA